MAQKYLWFEEYFGQCFSIATDKSEWKGKVPWDITKLAYEWHPGIEIARNQ